MAVLHVHSVDDPRALWAGGLGPPFPLTGQRVLHGSVEASLGRWIAFDGCPAAPEPGETRHWRDHTATRLRFAPCRDGVEVVLWKLTGAGHGWPGGAPVSRRLERLIGPSTQVIDATAEAWAFFQRFSRPDAPPPAPLSASSRTDRSGRSRAFRSPRAP